MTTKLGQTGETHRQNLRSVIDLAPNVVPDHAFTRVNELINAANTALVLIRSHASEATTN